MFTTKTVLGKIRDWYQAFCTTYKTHAMATQHGGAGTQNMLILTITALTAQMPPLP